MPEPTPQPLNYEPHQPSGDKPPVWRRWVPSPAALAIIILLCLLSLWLVIFLPPQAHRTPARVVRCASNLRQIYTSIQIYADGNRGALPPNLGATLEVSNFGRYPDVFVCPGSADTPAIGPTHSRRRARSRQAEPLLLRPGGAAARQAESAHQGPRAGVRVGKQPPHHPDRRPRQRPLRRRTGEAPSAGREGPNRGGTEGGV